MRNFFFSMELFKLLDLNKMILNKISSFVLLNHKTQDQIGNH